MSLGMAKGLLELLVTILKGYLEYYLLEVVEYEKLIKFLIFFS